MLRRILIGLAFLATLVAALYTEEDWRGKRAWENYKREAEARGERFDLASLVPPAVPDDQNFFCAPIVTNALKNSALFNMYRGDSKNWPADRRQLAKRNADRFETMAELFPEVQPDAGR